MHKSTFVEHLAATEVKDKSLITTGFQQNNTINIPKTSSAVEYYFRSYLSEELPDILLVIPPFIHERVYPLSVAYKRVHMLYDLVQDYVPTKVSVVWIPQITAWKFPHPANHKLGDPQLCHPGVFQRSPVHGHTCLTEHPVLETGGFLVEPCDIFC